MSFQKYKIFQDKSDERCERSVLWKILNYAERNERSK